MKNFLVLDAPPEKESLYQWDLNQRFVVVDPNVLQVQYYFSEKIGLLSCAIYEEDGTTYVNIPNIILQQSGSFRAYIYGKDHTIVHFQVSIEKRPKPDNYIYEETEAVSIKELVDAIIVEENLVSKEYVDSITTFNIDDGSGNGSIIQVGNTASGNKSVALGDSTIASGIDSFATGYATEASGDYSHAEGKYTKAQGERSHTEGANTIAKQFASHAEGDNTIASRRCQHVQGRFNIEDGGLDKDYGKYAHIVGNGTSNSDRSNAHTLDWDGNAWFLGDVSVGWDCEKLIKANEVYNNLGLSETENGTQINKNTKICGDLIVDGSSGGPHKPYDKNSLQQGKEVW